MHCNEVLDKVYESMGEPLPLLDKMMITFHRMWCTRCDEELEKLEYALELLHTDFFPQAPSLEDSIMEQLTGELFDVVPSLSPEDQLESTGLPLRGWIIIGCIVLISLSTVFFGVDFADTAARFGSSFLLPVGITIGGVLTGYGAIFIASHLKELSERFRLH
jgi:hypothetical protein